MIITIQIIGQFIHSIKDSELQIVTQNIDSPSAIAHAHQFKPNIILLDNGIKENRSPELIQSLLAASSKSKVILVGSSIQDNHLIKCLFASIYGYLEKKDFDKFLIKSIKSVHSGEAWITRRIVGKLIESIHG